MIYGFLPRGPGWLLKHLLSHCHPASRREDGHTHLLSFLRTLQKSRTKSLLRSVSQNVVAWLWPHTSGGREPGKCSLTLRCGGGGVLCRQRRGREQVLGASRLPREECKREREPCNGENISCPASAPEYLRYPLPSSRILAQMHRCGS